MSWFSARSEKDALARVYGDLVKRELGLNRPATFKDLRHSNNPIIRNAADYYRRKARYRYLPDFLGLVRWIPFALKKTPLYRFTKWLENTDGITLQLGAKTGFFTWYFIRRQTGSYYEAERIWNKTVGVKDLPNRAVNRSIQPGDFVNTQDIVALYESVAKELELQRFTPDDPLTSRLFDQGGTLSQPRLYTQAAGRAI